MLADLTRSGHDFGKKNRESKGWQGAVSKVGSLGNITDERITKA